MPEITLTQVEADALIRAEKHRVEDTVHPFPSPGATLRVGLVSIDGLERFSLDLRRGRMRLSKMTDNLRGRRVIVLLRLDIDGPPHRNPDGRLIPGPHLHIYREGFGAK